ncbi:hypothetical protein ADL15_03445 [Actinoplanes awajinensis subsp. mycoplanecinus]|uniref:Uncharacterized protein n=1 Tax=Actinoplanes awajinensis subsp. mycoplanecinus TaxID=135947 RepID=A0A0X3V938_9ACTN|nr:hypothetical protein ADL15_03445 [Actinoplanes awajinensis subsp. mycoplanecinus]
MGSGDPGEFLRLLGAAWEVPGVAELLHTYENRSDVAALGLEVDDGMVIFHAADPAVAEAVWGFPVGAGDPDPPTFVDNGAGWRPYLDHLSLTCVDIALTAVIDGGEWYNAAELPADLVPSVAANFDRVPLPDLPMWIDVEESPVRWYSRPGLLLRTHGDDGAWLWVRALTRTGLESVYRALPGVTWSQ